MTNEKNNIEQLLGKIEKVDAPPFLLTRIEARLEQTQELLPRRWSVAYLSLAVVVVLFNVYVIVQNNDNRSSVTEGATELASSLNMNTSNQIYYE
ncbi:MAG: hypothetical protein CL840_18905 [Crocinitomicaceae bacterium]|nr:hypothetical protein [Crocinitomicaceae bacterium]|tara:strand:+ start:3789 stop:4073 length:285 start_codon:yes stop_codon:yes gene_type:complete